MGTSKISADLNQRTFDVEVPDENVGDVLEKLMQLFDRIPPTGGHPSPANRDSAAPPEAVEDSGFSEDNAEPQEKTRRKRGSTKGPTKIRSYQLIDLGLNQTQRLEIQQFFKEKSPKGQNDQVAVLAVKLKELTGRYEFSVDDIHSAFKIVNLPTPRNLTAVLGNMKRDGRGGYSDNKLIVNSFTEDHVSYHMNSGAKETK